MKGVGFCDLVLAQIQVRMGHHRALGNGMGLSCVMLVGFRVLNEAIYLSTPIKFLLSKTWHLGVGRSEISQNRPKSWLRIKTTTSECEEPSHK